MSNSITIQRITENKTGTQGAIVSDNYGADYNFFEELPTDDVKLIETVFNMSSGCGTDYLNDLMEHIEENKTGISVDGSYIEFETFKHLLETKAEQ